MYVVLQQTAGDSVCIPLVSTSMPQHSDKDTAASYISHAPCALNSLSLTKWARSQGLAKAIFNLGLMYEKRRGIDPDAPEADLLEVTRECYQAAAEAGVTKAMVNLGVLYMSGRLTGHEQGGALEWFKKAADEGDMSGKR